MQIFGNNLGFGNETNEQTKSLQVLLMCGQGLETLTWRAWLPTFIFTFSYLCPLWDKQIIFKFPFSWELIKLFQDVVIIFFTAILPFLPPLAIPSPLVEYTFPHYSLQVWLYDILTNEMWKWHLCQFWSKVLRDMASVHQDSGSLPLAPTVEQVAINLSTWIL